MTDAPNPAEFNFAQSTLPALCVVQRCRHYMLWPENTYSDSRSFKIPGLKAPKLRDASFRVGFRAYQNRKRFDDVPEELGGDVFKFMWQERSVGFWVGDTVYFEGPGHGFLQNKFAGPRQGEVDVYISVESDEDLDVDETYEVLSPYLPSLVLHISLITKDWLVPTAPACGVKRQGGASMLSNASGVTLAAVPRVITPLPQLNAAFSDFAHLLATMNAEERVTLDRAAKRIETAGRELDVIDRYCDYWEACEFITKARKYKVDSRITNRLREVTGFNKKVLDKEIVGPLYSIRCDIVHNAVERLDRVNRALPILAGIAIILRAAAVGGVYGPRGELANYYRAALARTAAPLSRCRLAPRPRGAGGHVAGDSRDRPRLRVSGVGHPERCKDSDEVAFHRLC